MLRRLGFAIYARAGRFCGEVGRDHVGICGEGRHLSVVANPKSIF